jgi:rRNA maturation RNase YbeY
MPLLIQNRQRTVAIHTVLIKKRVQQVLTYLGCADQELSIVFASDRLMQALNRAYRQQDHPTNVLAFPQRPIHKGEPATALLGDVIVSLPTAAREACILHQALEERVLYLLVHGILHLLGYDHDRSVAERRRMEAREQDILGYLQSRGL